MIKVNKEDMEFEKGMTVEDVLKKKKYTFRMITVIVNGRVVPKDKYATYTIKDNDNIDVVHIMSGG
ncbi:sulfur carrier protein ThiS [Biomaibacter acetigenes]|uniref:Sulfur carrier protein ThiS n=1 Tax=Biomaibacter acetigenes TaxID=2316383 RepID=A0A3G2R3U1_9FIRM|nr:sulfur carrier protein ThiS [Biomaibacter acetigenes]AYO30021.1 sulfur carrier protein ThiS [Biomaibacter acetigenes]RKL63449.1 sulfur carrier protein ThiS [Thermoanaerobacteraceae bacterium SP2]